MTRRLFLCCCAVLLLRVSPAAAQDQLRIVPIVSDRQVLVSFEFQDAYTDELREVIESGLPTTLTYDLELRMPARVWVDRTIATAAVAITVQYDNLTRRYSLTRTVDGRVEDALVTEREEEVRRWLTTVHRLPLCSISKLQRNREYYVRVRGHQRPQRSLFPLDLVATVNGQTKFTFVP
ncbi:MAG TPA: DUF4390 domain-containing protein [Vicinamibacterales bacterium]|nr:DUF4390 domain-containing protein [Vicinamibacterales bacterium]